MQIPDLVKKLTEECGTDNPFLICKSLDIPVIRTALPASINGFYKHGENQKCIILNESLDENKARFCCAHELGHAMMHENINSLFLSSSTYFCTEKLEKQADTFAVFLLLEDADALYERLGICTLDQISSYYGIDRKTAKLRYESTVQY